MAATIWLHGSDSASLAQALTVHTVHEVNAAALPKTTPDLLLLASSATLEEMLLAQVSASQLQQHWQQQGLAAIEVAQAAISRMLKQRRNDVHKGTVVFCGSVLAIQPQAQYLLQSSLQAGLRNVAQSLAREFAPQGIHVVYVASPLQARPEDIAALALQLHQQPLSVWTQEVLVQSQ